MQYSVSITPSARRDLSRIHGKDYARIEAVIDALAEDPRPAGCVKLAGDDNAWRIRVGDYRVVYEVQWRFLRMDQYPQGESNPCCRTENPES